MTFPLNRDGMAGLSLCRGQRLWNQKGKTVDELLLHGLLTHSGGIRRGTAHFLLRPSSDILGLTCRYRDSAFNPNLSEVL